MDGIFCVMDANSNMEITLDKFNCAHLAISFIMEQEVENTIAFKVQLNVQFINTHIFFIFVPLWYRRNLVHSLASRARKLCSEDRLNQELNLCEKILLQKIDIQRNPFYGT